MLMVLFLLSACCNRKHHHDLKTAKALDLTGAETDGRLLAVRSRFSRDWNLVDFLAYLIGYL